MALLNSSLKGSALTSSRQFLFPSDQLLGSMLSNKFSSAKAKPRTSSSISSSSTLM